MNKIIEILYADATADNSFYSDESEAMYKRVSDTAIGYGVMSFAEQNDFTEKLVDYAVSVEAIAFEVGFRMAMELFAGGDFS